MSKSPAEPNTSLPHVLRRLWNYGRRYRWLYVATSVAMVMLNFLSFLRPYLLKLLTDNVLTGQSLEGKVPLLCELLGAIFAATVLKGLFTFAQGYSLAIAAQGTVRAVREQMFERLHRLPIQWFERNRVGDMLVRFTDDLRVLTEFLMAGLSILVNDSLTVVMSLSWMIYKDWQLTFVAMVVTPAAGMVVRRYAKRMKDATDNAQKTLSDLSSHVKESVEGIKVVKSFSQEHREVKRFSRHNDDSFRWAMKMVQLTATQSPMLEVLATAGIALVLWYCALNIMTGALTLGDMLAFWGYMLLATTPINRMPNTLQLVTRGTTASGRLFEILDQTPEAGFDEKAARAALPSPLSGRIEFRDVRFRYQEDREEALRGVDLTIEPGEHVVLVGRNGAGKSTLVNLIPRFYESSGDIRIDGVSIHDVPLVALRRNIAIVPQDTFLFSGSVAENIGYGCDGATQEMIEEAARAAGCHGFIDQMEEKYQTPLWENARNLSGGQRQRIAIARMILCNPSIVILDEATSALDPEAERAIHETLMQVTKGKTVINVIHRLALAQHADRIVVLEQGKVAESGTHDELMTAKGIYHTLYTSMFEPVS